MNTGRSPLRPTIPKRPLPFNKLSLAQVYSNASYIVDMYLINLASFQIGVFLLRLFFVLFFHELLLHFMFRHFHSYIFQRVYGAGSILHLRQYRPVAPRPAEAYKALQFSYLTRSPYTIAIAALLPHYS